MVGCVGGRQACFAMGGSRSCGSGSGLHPEIGGIYELFFQGRGGLEVGRVRLIRLRLCGRGIQRTENLRFVVIRIPGGERLEGLGARLLTRTFGTRRKILVVRGNRLDVIALALSLRRDAPSLIDCGLRGFRTFWRCALAGEWIQIRMALRTGCDVHDDLGQYVADAFRCAYHNEGARAHSPAGLHFE